MIVEQGNVEHVLICHGKNLNVPKIKIVNFF